MGKRGIRRIQDCIHGLMEFRGMENSIVEVLRAQELQRLRKVRQLGLGHLVFPGAEHSRLVHSLGAAYLSLRFTRHLATTTQHILANTFIPDEENMRDLGLAALCHDLGHGPLSHLWEREIIKEDFDLTKWRDTLGIPHKENEIIRYSKLKWHELVGQALMAWEDGELHKLIELLDQGASERIRHLIAGEYYVPYFPRLLSSDIDVDRCDFILRDAHQTGVAYGLYDLNWLISTTTIGFTDRDELVVGFDKRKAIPVIEQYLIARRSLYKTVYYHKTVRSAEGMIGLLFNRLAKISRESGWPLHEEMTLFEPFRIVAEGQQLRPEQIMGLDDYSLWVMIQELAVSKRNLDLTLADLARRIVARDLFKIVPCKPERLENKLRLGDFREKIREVIEPHCEGDPDSYFHIDVSDFRMLSKEKSCSYLIDTDDSQRKAEPLFEHQHFLNFRAEEGKVTRLFVLREAVNDVAQFIGR